MSNPVLSEKVFKKESVAAATGASMTVAGTATKTIMLLLMVFAGAAYSWKIFYEAMNPAAVMPWMWGGVIVGFILAIIISFSPKTAPYLSPVYAAAEGLFLGAISAYFNEAFAQTAPGIVINAVLLTIITALLMMGLYRSRIIKVDAKFMRIMLVSIGAIAVYYLLSIVLSLFGVNISMLHDGGWLSIGISLVIVGVAAFSLMMDYHFIETASAAGAPKYMEWYGAFGLTVTLVWLYLEILRLLSKFASRN